MRKAGFYLGNSWGQIQKCILEGFYIEQKNIWFFKTPYFQWNFPIPLLKKKCLALQPASSSCNPHVPLWIPEATIEFLLVFSCWHDTGIFFFSLPFTQLKRKSKSVFFLSAVPLLWNPSCVLIYKKTVCKEYEGRHAQLTRVSGECWCSSYRGDGI